MDRIATPNEMRKWADGERRRGHTIGFVPTMGALHVGHMELIRSAFEEADVVVVSVFVNPLQFDGQHDLDCYPRSLEADIEVCAELGVDVVYVPTAEIMYPPGFQTRVTPGSLAEIMEGAARAGHFDGVLTIVTKLFNAVLPHRAVFGEKDYQQLAILRQTAADLNLGIEIVGHPIVREPDGLAMSSRNARLNERQRVAAICLPRALEAAGRVALRPQCTVTEVLDAAQAIIVAEPQAVVDYIAIFDAASLQPLTDFAADHRRSGKVRIAAAVQFDEVRLIDNRDLFGG